MVIAALLSFAVLLIAWIFAPSGSSTEALTLTESEALSAAA